MLQRNGLGGALTGADTDWNGSMGAPHLMRFLEVICGARIAAPRSDEPVTKMPLQDRITSKAAAAPRVKSPQDCCHV